MSCLKIYFFNQILSSTPFIYYYRYILYFPKNVLNIQIIGGIMLWREIYEMYTKLILTVLLIILFTLTITND